MLSHVSLTGEDKVRPTFENPGGFEERQVGEDTDESRPALDDWFLKPGDRRMRIYCNSPYFDAFCNYLYYIFE